jgi:hypothetical protein
MANEFNANIGLEARKYIEVLEDKVFDMVRGCSFSDKILITVTFLDGGVKEYSLGRLGDVLKYNQKILKVVFHLNEMDYVLQLYGGYIQKKDRLYRIKEFCRGKDIIIEEYRTGVWSIENRWVKKSFDKWNKEMYHIDPNWEPIHIFEKGRGRSKRQVLIREIFPFSKSLHDFENMISRLAREIENFVPDILPEVKEVDEIITDGTINVLGDLYQISGDVHQNFSNNRGEDWRCASCGNLNSDNLYRCNNCDAPKC